MQLASEEGFLASETTDRTRGAVRMAYLMSRYPAVSHTFFLNEIAELRRLGMEIHAASINSAQSLSAVETTEAAQTFYVKDCGTGAALKCCLRTLFSRPGVVWRGLRAALGAEGVRPYAFYYFAEAMLLGEWMQQRGLRHLHIHFGGPVASVGRLTAIAWGFGYSMTIHGSDEFYNEEKFHLREKVRDAQFVVCISEFCRSQLMRLVPADDWGKFLVGRLGVDVGVFVPRPVRTVAMPVEVMCVGRLVAAKGQRVLLEACRGLLERGVSVRVTLVGDGEDGAGLRAYVARSGIDGSVYFAGATSHAETQRLLAQADIFVLASFAEGVPVALMEAMASQLPCVSTYVAGIPELITSEQDGLLVPAGSVEALGWAIERLAKDASLRGRLGIAARERVVKDYNLRLNVERLAAIFGERVQEERVN